MFIAYECFTRQSAGLDDKNYLGVYSLVGFSS